MVITSDSNIYSFVVEMVENNFVLSQCTQFYTSDFDINKGLKVLMMSS